MTSAHITTHEHKPAASAPPVATARCRTARGTVRGTGRAPLGCTEYTTHTDPQTPRKPRRGPSQPATPPHATRPYCATHAPRQTGFSLPAAPGYTRGEPSSRELARRCGAVRCAVCGVRCALHPRDTPRRSDPTESGQRTHACRPCMLTRERGRREHQASVRCCRGSSHCHAPGIGFSWAMELSKMRPLGSLRRMRSLDQRSSIYTAVVGVC